VTATANVQLPPYGTREFYQAIGRRGGLARAQMPDFRDHQRHAGRRSAAINDMAALGHKGAQAFIRKYGYIKFFHFWRIWKLRNPSAHERQIATILRWLNYSFEREAMVLGDRVPLAVDFYIPDANDSIIEVNGRIHYDPFFDHPHKLQTRRDLDLHRIRRLERAGFRILEIDHRAMSKTNEPLIIGKIAGFLVNAPERQPGGSSCAT
jgi:very-short-patch-repair endonuclease